MSVALSLTVTFHLFQEVAAFLQLRIYVISKVLNMDHAWCLLALCRRKVGMGISPIAARFSAVAGFSPKYFSHTWLSGTVADPYSAINKNIVFIFTSHYFQATIVATSLIYSLNPFIAVVAANVWRLMMAISTLMPQLALRPET